MLLEAIGIILAVIFGLFVLFVAFGYFLKRVHDARQDRAIRALHAAIDAHMAANPGVTREEAIDFFNARNGKA
ncbi:hypothetical protein [Paraburkholderia sp. BL21I4N1]|uniref:hypothetical protein n=1 Tax=Paraburkholderia sp. BL21I4N1 TaxID=1938801 RepID=UPI000D4F7934|nr:hypothetical protein [Paraburkholderia sp. BL21I4N1]PQV53397.1 hypothetical protein B0G83_102483 [Paraburkholderia sp. BL21I4N1]